MSSAQDRVKVYARLRPANVPDDSGTPEASAVVADIPAAQLSVTGYGRDTKNFVFDGVFGTQSTQLECNTEIRKPLVGAVIKGFRAALLAYGQTGSFISPE